MEWEFLEGPLQKYVLSGKMLVYITGILMLIFKHFIIKTELHYLISQCLLAKAITFNFFFLT